MSALSFASILTDQKDVEQVVIQKWFNLTPIDLFWFEFNDILWRIARIYFEVFLLWRNNVYSVRYLIDLIQLRLEVSKSRNGRKQNHYNTY